jgi:predicted O-methyltransferase YrrM
MTTYNDQLSNYIGTLFAQEDESLQRVIVDSRKQGFPPINIKPEEGRFLQLLARACGAQKALEIGTFHGYSTIWIARGMLPGGCLITLEQEPKRAEIAQSHFEAAGLGDMIDVRVGDAHSLLIELVDEGPFDFVFIDAEKPGYPAYFDWAIENTRIGGVIAIHNAFSRGNVAGLQKYTARSRLMRQFNQQVADETRLISTIFPAGDGTLISVKIS